jgi:hypothetical protein
VPCFRPSVVVASLKWTITQSLLDDITTSQHRQRKTINAAAHFQRRSLIFYLAHASSPTLSSVFHPPTLIHISFPSSGSHPLTGSYLFSVIVNIHLGHLLTRKVVEDAWENLESTERLSSGDERQTVKPLNMDLESGPIVSV